jgi:maleamate amidohydrolase
VVGEWRGAIPRDDWETYEAAGFGRSAGLGSRPAVLVIDVQYRTVGDAPLPIGESMRVHYKTSCGEVGWRSVAAIETLLGVARSAGVPIIYPHVAPKSDQELGRTGAKIPSLWEVPDRGYQFVEEVRPQAGDHLLPKRHPSAFFGTALVSTLIDLGIDTLILTGCTTSGCVRATAVDAFAYNFHCAVIEECVYDRSLLSHQVNLFDLQAKYADVLTLDQGIEYLEALPDARPVTAPS